MVKVVLLPPDSQRHAVVAGHQIYTYISFVQEGSQGTPPAIALLLEADCNWSLSIWQLSQYVSSSQIVWCVAG